MRVWEIGNVEVYNRELASGHDTGYRCSNDARGNVPQVLLLPDFFIIVSHRKRLLSHGRVVWKVEG